MNEMVSFQSPYKNIVIWSDRNSWFPFVRSPLDYILVPKRCPLFLGVGKFGASFMFCENGSRTVFKIISFYLIYFWAFFTCVISDQMHSKGSDLAVIPSHYINLIEILSMKKSY